MKISASIYSQKEKNLPELISMLDAYQVDSFHIDCNNNPGVFEDIKQIRALSKTPIDLHIISDNPQPFINKAAEMGIEYVQVQLEDAVQPFHFPKEGKCRFGISIISETPVESFAPYADSAFFVLFMTTTPGQSGGVFNKENFRRIRKFASLFPGKRIHVDGGVNGEVSFILRLLGADYVVSGSFLVNHQFPGAAMLDLLHREVNSSYKIADFMYDGPEMPVIPEKNCTFLDSVAAIEKYKNGFVFYTDDNGKLTGISSNADIRRAVLKHPLKLSDVPPHDFINRNPLTVNQNQNISELLKLIKKQTFPVNFLPVVDDEFRLTGYLTFNSLIRGES
jgi:pentose-5-phosphate-3-epimerase